MAFDCTVSASKRTVLVLNGVSEMGYWEPAMLIDSSERKEELGCFSPDDNTEAFHSCSLVWNNQLYIYGGENNRNGFYVKLSMNF